MKQSDVVVGTVKHYLIYWKGVFKMRLKKDQWINDFGEIVCPHTPFPLTTLTNHTNPYIRRHYCAGCNQTIDGYGMVLHLDKWK